jgi:1,4-alpha-glucan branching enzyme
VTPRLALELDPPVLQLAPARPEPEAVARLLAGRHHDPHTVLGAHGGKAGVAVRALRPGAERVLLETPMGRVALDEGEDGLFTGLMPSGWQPDYQLVVIEPGAERRERIEPDGYRFAPTLGELDLHLIREGRHEQLWRALGSHLRTVDGVAGTAFAVWAPNAVGVRLVGDFNHWDGTGFPMRSLGSSGVWELFVPGLGAGTASMRRPRRLDPRSPR